MKSLRSVAAFILLAVLGACGGADREAPPANVLERGLASDPETLDFHKARSTQAAEVQRVLGEGLVGYSPGGSLPLSTSLLAPRERLE
jgi:ABC-type oligopeptide transport system substrate-binding subunit